MKKLRFGTIKPQNPKEWALYDIQTRKKSELEYSISVGKICKCGKCYCCELNKLIG